MGENGKMSENGKMGTLAHKYMTAHWLGTDTLTKRDGIQLVLLT